MIKHAAATLARWAERGVPLFAEPGGIPSGQRLLPHRVQRLAQRLGRIDQAGAGTVQGIGVDAVHMAGLGGRQASLRQAARLFALSSCRDTPASTASGRAASTLSSDTWGATTGESAKTLTPPHSRRASLTMLVRFSV